MGTFNASAGDTVSVAIGSAGVCIGLEAADPAGATYASTLQGWAKPVGRGGAAGVALLIINPDTRVHEVTVPLANLPLAGGQGGTNLTSVEVHVRDIWARANAGTIDKGAAGVTKTVGPLDS